MTWIGGNAALLYYVPTTEWPGHIVLPLSV